MINAALLEETMGVIEGLVIAGNRDGKRWMQETYRCQSGMCFAGWAAHLSGAQWVVQDKDLGDTRGWASQVIIPDGTPMIYGETIFDAEQAEYFDLPVGTRTVVVSAYVEHVLGHKREIVIDDETHDLFSGGNDIEDLRKITKALLNEEHRPEAQGG